MLKGCKIKIYPNQKQEEILLIYCKYSHIIRNFLVEKFLNNLPRVCNLGVIGYNEKKLLCDFGETEIPLPTRLIRGILINYGISVERFYKKISNKPVFHKYNPNRQSFYIANYTYKITNYTIPLPHNNNFKIPKISRIKIDKKYIDKFNITEIKEPVFKKINNNWYICGTYEIKDPKPKEAPIIGLDWGIKNFMTSSNGEFINYPKSVEREFYRINKLKSLRDKKVKGSNNWNKLNNKIILAYERFENLKRNFIEQTTTYLCKNNNVAIEDLTKAKIKTSNKNRRRIQMIAPLNRFTLTLDWKCQKFGTKLYKVNPAYTSQTCNKCKLIHKISLNERIFKCSCGNWIDRDINAAINIADKAIRSSF